MKTYLIKSGELKATVQSDRVMEIGLSMLKETNEYCAIYTTDGSAMHDMVGDDECVAIINRAGNFYSYGKNYKGAAIVEFLESANWGDK